MSTATIESATALSAPVRFSVPAAISHLKFVWPGVVRRDRAVIDAALEQVDGAFVDRFLEDHPRADGCAIARCGAHELILRGLSRREPAVYWVEGRLLGSYRAYGIFADEIEQIREADRSRVGARRARCSGS